MKAMILALGLVLLGTEVAQAHGFQQAPRFFAPGGGCGGCYGGAPVFVPPPSCAPVYLPPPRVFLPPPVYAPPSCAPQAPCAPHALGYGAGFAPGYGVGFAPSYGRGVNFGLHTPGFNLHVGAGVGAGRIGLLDRFRLNRLERLQRAENRVALKLFR